MEGNSTPVTNANITSVDAIAYLYLPQYLEQCYAFPFGIIGWVLHSASVYVVTRIWIGAKPLQPWKGIAYGGRSMFLSALTLGFSLGSTIATGLRWRHHWSLVVIAVGKGSSSTLNAIAGIYVSFTCRRRKNRERQGHSVRSDEYLVLCECACGSGTCEVTVF
ncbi:hypothetical protein FA13DRAFT_1737098 [Coprinellus micaceus]|uniref:Uncharacterized protein n=1 Tax=Coprinellus micaceus TaxID=71717 RepID=A0A4Y7SYE4_COPMI|nr:hypothetical protein FA13DRAFT_1737098 [Coprinellus micaceus]